MSRCAACDKRLEGNELYRVGHKFDMCSKCIPFDDEESGDDLVFHGVDLWEEDGDG